MKQNELDQFYDTTLRSHGFEPADDVRIFNQIGKTYRLSPEIGCGYYWIYTHENLFCINIHDFYYHEDRFLDSVYPECLSISYYESISGDEIAPYRRMNANCVRSYLGGYGAFKALIHKKIPIKSVGIEIMPDYYKGYLKNTYPSEYRNPFEAFRSIDETYCFPEMMLLLKQIKNYSGDGISARLFFESKVAEAVSLIVTRYENLNAEHRIHISEKDIQQIQDVTAFINDHISYALPLSHLSKIACMGSTKLKQSFKIIHGCTITEFIQQRRIGQAEYLLSHTDLPIAQVAKTVGYSNPSRFTELFRKSIGILPNEYRRTIHP